MTPRIEVREWVESRLRSAAPDQGEASGELGSASVRPVAPSSRLALSRALVWVAALVGVVHAGFSAYWATGGQWLLSTVGQWAVDLSQESPVAAGAGLGAVALVKLLAAVVPVAVAHGRLPGRTLWRGVSWAGGVLLLVYGGLNVVVSGAVLLGAIRPEGGYDADAMKGHALLWDPLFVLWGAALVLSLWLSRQSAGAVRQRVDDRA